MRRVALALVHHPVLDRAGECVTTAITNLDLHDMARSACTYGSTDLFVIHPIAAQRDLALRIREHWVTGSGKKRIPDRATALELVRVVESIAEMLEAFGGRDAVEVWTTAASARWGELTSYGAARERVRAPGKPILILFGTGWGLARELIESADLRLEPIRGALDTGYNHLSVRAACSITLDRLLG